MCTCAAHVDAVAGTDGDGDPGAACAGAAADGGTGSGNQEEKGPWVIQIFACYVARTPPKNRMEQTGGVQQETAGAHRHNKSQVQQHRMNKAHE